MIACFAAGCGLVLLVIDPNWLGAALAASVVAITLLVLRVMGRGPERSEDTRPGAGEAGP